MKSLTKAMALILLLIAVTTLIFMSASAIKISAEAKQLNEAVTLSKNIAEIFAEADNEKEFISFVETEWKVEKLDERLNIESGEYDALVITEAEKSDKGSLIKMDVLVFRDGERIYDLDTLKYIRGEGSYYE